MKRLTLLLTASSTAAGCCCHPSPIAELAFIERDPSLSGPTLKATSQEIVPGWLAAVLAIIMPAVLAFLLPLIIAFWPARLGGARVKGGVEPPRQPGAHAAAGMPDGAGPATMAGEPTAAAPLAAPVSAVAPPAVASRRSSLIGAAVTIFFFWLALAEAITIELAGITTIKNVVGWKSPNFFAGCDYAGYRTALQTGNFAEYLSLTSPGVPGSVSKCRDSSYFNENRRSYPSGHASTAFAGLGILVAYFRWFLNVPRGNWFSIRGALAASPLILAAWISISRLLDFVHHPYDINAGAIIGIFGALIAWRQFAVDPKRDPLRQRYSMVMGYGYANATANPIAVTTGYYGYPLNTPSSSMAFTGGADSGGSAATTIGTSSGLTARNRGASSAGLLASEVV